MKTVQQLIFDDEVMTAFGGGGGGGGGGCGGTSCNGSGSPSVGFHNEVNGSTTMVTQAGGMCFATNSGVFAASQAAGSAGAAKGFALGLAVGGPKGGLLVA